MLVQLEYLCIPMLRFLLYPPITLDFYPSPWQRPLHLLNMRIDGNLMQNHLKGFIVLRNLLRGMENYDTFGEYYDLSVSVGFRIEAGL